MDVYTKHNIVPICSTKVIGYYPPLERNFGKCFSYSHRSCGLPRITCCFRADSQAASAVTATHWKWHKRTGDAAGELRWTTIAMAAMGFPRYGAIHQLFGAGTFPIFSRRVFTASRRNLWKNLRMWHKRLQNVAGVCHWHVEGVMLTTRKLA